MTNFYDAWREDVIYNHDLDIDIIIAFLGDIDEMEKANRTDQDEEGNQDQPEA